MFTIFCMNKNKFLNILLIAFLAIETFLTIFIFIVQKNRYFALDWFRYGGVIICFLFSLLSFKNKHNHFLIAGLAFTIVADYFLIILNDYYIVGIAFFTIVQAMYFCYIAPKHWLASLITRFSIAGIVSLLITFVLKVSDATSYAAVFYYTNLVMNAVDAFINKNKSLLLFAIGLVLFIGCDTFVGLFNLSDFITINSSAFKILEDNCVLIIWIFYLPSQTLISLSPFLNVERPKIYGKTKVEN